MLLARPRRWFSWDYQIFDGSRTVATLDIAWLGERAVFDLDGVEFRIVRDGLTGPFQLLHREAVICAAHKAFTRRYSLEIQGRSMVLEAVSPWRRPFELEEGGEVIGRIAPRSLFRREVEVDLPEELPLELQLFLVFLTLILWRRTDNAAAAGS